MSRSKIASAFFVWNKINKIFIYKKILKGEKIMNKYIEQNMRYVAVTGGFNDESQTITMGMLQFNEEENKEFVLQFPKSLNEQYLKSKGIAGEIYATMSAINQAIKDNIPNITILYHYVGVERWATGEWQAEAEVAKRYLKYLEQAQKYIQIQYLKIDKEDEDYQALREKTEKLAETINESNQWIYFEEKEVVNV